MPLGIAKLNTLSRYIVPAAPAAQRTAVEITGYNGAAIDTADYEFGGSSIFLDRSSSQWLETGDIPGFGSTDDFTYECWFNYDSITSPQFLFGNRNGTVGNYITVYFDGSSMFGYYHNQTAKISFTAPGTGWHHFAVVRYNGDVKCYIDGTQAGSTYNATNDVINTESFAIGANDYTRNGAHGWEGHIDEIRFSNVARYTGSFTPSTTPFVNDSNTLFLCHADGTDADTVFLDDNGDRAPLGIQANGDAQLSTTKKQFGNSSLVFDGTGDYLAIDGMTSPGTGDFTVEFWVYPTATGNDGIFHWCKDGFSNGAGGVNEEGLAVAISNSTTWRIYARDNDPGSFTFSGTVDTTGWQHIALVRSSGTLTLYRNGTSLGSITDTSNYNDIGKLRIGAYYNSSFGVVGNVDEFRVSDIARYTGSFTPSTTAFTNDANTLLLLHAEEGASGTTEIFDDNGQTLPAPPTLGTGLYGIDNGGSAELYTYGFDNTTTPITVSCYLYFNSFSSVDIIFEDFKNGIPSFQFTIESGRPSLTCKTGSNAYIYQALDTSNTYWPSTGAWYWFGVSVDPSNTSNRAFVYQEVGSSTVTSVPIYKSRNNTGTYDTNYFNRDTSIGIGGRGNGGVEIDGAMSDFLIDYGNFVDFTNATTRANWISSTGDPQDWGSDGSTALGTTPDIFLSGPVGTMDVTNQGTNTTTGGNSAVINKRGTFTDVDGPSV